MVPAYRPGDHSFHPHCGSGTIGLLHMSCYERWLGCSNTTKSELCAFQFCVKKTPRPWKWYMREPSVRQDRRLLCREVLLTATLGLIVLIVDALCFTFADRLRAETNIGPAAVLIVIGMMTVTLFVAWLLTRTQSSQKTESDADVSAKGLLDLNGSLPSYNAANSTRSEPKNRKSTTNILTRLSSLKRVLPLGWLSF